MRATNASLSPSNTSALSLEIAQSIRKKSKRKNGVPLPKSFLRTEHPDEIPALRKLQGAGRGGGSLSVKLYISIIMLATKYPYTVEDITAEAWAKLLDLKNPGTTGRERIYKALNKLEENRLIKVTRYPGKPPKIELKNHLSGGDYITPQDSYLKEKVESNYYFKIDEEFWTNGYIQQLSSPALSFYLILLAESGNKNREVWFTSNNFQERYKFSSAVRTQGSKQLEEIGLVKVRSEPIDRSGKKEESIYKKERRKIYTLISPKNYSKK
ncbi:hypothetical protein [Rothia nasimurium]|uniref:hypothetical protein n=1 Tax=Rothia nasimurium TaxID=85336 RepID=UPI001F33998E|nr:hypothetical protein [Rothia nasimurium]